MKAKDSAQQVIYKVINPLIKTLIKLKITPNIITTVGLAINIAAVVVFIIGGDKGATGDLSYIGWGCGLILFAGLFDMIDGRLARVGNMSSRLVHFMIQCLTDTVSYLCFSASVITWLHIIIS
jgi:CDP-diacylglycerol---glycerol-3-phosphate 3-phosphatidyltransferase